MRILAKELQALKRARKARWKRPERSNSRDGSTASENSAESRS